MQVKYCAKRVVIGLDAVQNSNAAHKSTPCIRSIFDMYMTEIKQWSWVSMILGSCGSSQDSYKGFAVTDVTD